MASSRVHGVHCTVWRHPDTGLCEIASVPCWCAGDAPEGGWGDKDGGAASGPGGSAAKDDVASKFAPGIKFKLAV
jgi:hypothetical protein